MRAVQFHGARDVRVETVSEPFAQPNQVLIDIEWCGICGSDLHEYKSGPQFIQRKQSTQTTTGECQPVTMGHEFCGRVRELPDSYTGALKVGLPVMVDPRLVCGHCDACVRSASNVCKDLGFLGLSGGGGGLSETVAVDVNKCYALPENAELEIAALIEPLAVARHAVRVSKLDKFHDLTVLVLGGGPIGQAVVHDLAVQGAGQVLLSEPAEARQKQVRNMKATVIDPSKDDVAVVCLERTQGVGVDVVFDCAGAAAAMNAAFSALRVKGTYVTVAGWQAPFTVPFAPLMLKEVSILGSMAYDDQDFAEVVRNFCEGKYKNLADMVTSRIGFAQVVQEGFEQLISSTDSLRHVKILVTPRQELLRV
ncbi:chlorophyll synthesis pathway protein BchC [Cyphellophora europaea CBS 101466]|uniref:Chlorophyll synthesis pathway protein BchC n=1 Tax=Cyphellophora europaea (strain CBS 101466) TaxID=1220924 RepID=W2RYH1_CYPE1|nr:chlorophyll synthesis pathway protein BchC [Cyphellophora europaea CBS 101466]ETN41546.1 chlorophyll synthesis pathway protein BchC [Cyphellophora europaea CBS 101466]